MTSPEDFVIFPCGPLGSRYAVSSEATALGEFTSLEMAEEAIRDRMERDQFWPSVWFMSDHGNIDAYEMGTA